MCFFFDHNCMFMYRQCLLFFVVGGWAFGRAWDWAVILVAPYVSLESPLQVRSQFHIQGHGCDLLPQQLLKKQQKTPCVSWLFSFPTNKMYPTHFP